MSIRVPKDSSAPPEQLEETIDFGELLRTGDRLFAAADQARASALGQLAGLRTARSYVLQRERAELADAGVSPDRLASLDGAIARTTELARSLAAQAELAGRSIPIAKPDEAIVYGFVRTADGRAASGVKLLLADAKGQVFDSSATDGDGHFQLRAILEKVPRRLQLQVHHGNKPVVVEVDLVPGGVELVPVRVDG
ncbi:MAG: hypothetical protein ACTHU0_11210 [Kofleriaceae bacterium]